jgi:hypothetical protein
LGDVEVVDAGGTVVVVDYSQAMASIARACPRLREMDHVTGDEEGGEHMRLFVSRGGAVAFAAGESATGGADGFTTTKVNVCCVTRYWAVALIPRIDLCLIYIVGRSCQNLWSNGIGGIRST